MTDEEKIESLLECIADGEQYILHAQMARWSAQQAEAESTVNEARRQLAALIFESSMLKE